MFLTVDIGNTTTKIAIFQGKRIVCSTRLSAEEVHNKRSIVQQLKKLSRKNKNNSKKLEAIIICSVVPKENTKFILALKSVFKIKPLLLGKNIKVPIKNCYKKPRQVGQDRLANAIAAFNKFSGPVIVVDFGTALTFDVVSKNGEYLGGVIVPGLEISLGALIGNAALLGPLSLKRPRSLLGRETSASITSGIVYGYGYLVEGIISGLQKQLRTKAYVVATGGIAPLISHYCPSVKSISTHLTLEGIGIAYKMSNKRKKVQN